LSTSLEAQKAKQSALPNWELAKQAQINISPLLSFRELQLLKIKPERAAMAASKVVNVVPNRAVLLTPQSPSSAVA
jgi:hypothetical protein